MFERSFPNTALLFIYIRKELYFQAKLEGTQSSFLDLMLFENNQNLKSL